MDSSWLLALSVTFSPPTRRESPNSNASSRRSRVRSPIYREPLTPPDDEPTPPSSDQPGHEVASERLPAGPRLMSDELPRVRRTAIPSLDPVYSEVDVAEMRVEWARGERERAVQSTLDDINGQLKTMPDLIRSIARETVVAVLAEDRQRATRRVGASFTIVDKVFIALIAIGTLFAEMKAAHVL